MPLENEARIRIVVERVHVEGNGPVLLTGPSSCGKGEIAKSICTFLSISSDQHVSMGEVLRQTIDAARTDDSFRRRLGDSCGISAEISIFDESYNPSDLVKKAQRYEGELNRLRNDAARKISQFDWLGFCVRRGLLIPDDFSHPGM